MLRRHRRASSSLSLGTNQHRVPSQGCPAPPSCTTGHSGPGTHGSVSGQTPQPTSSSPPTCPFPGRGGRDHISCKRCHESQAESLPHTEHADLALAALRGVPDSPSAMHYHLSPAAPVRLKRSRLQQRWVRERKEKVQGKKVIFQIKEFCLMHCII